MIGAYFLSKSKKTKKRNCKLKCASGEDQPPDLNTCEANNDLHLCQPI